MKKDERKELDLVLGNIIQKTPSYNITTYRLPNKWLASSALHKGILRGNIRLALSGLDTLWEISPRYAKHVITSISLKEIGIGASDIVGATIHACSFKYIQRCVNYKSLRPCVIALALSPKENSSRHIHNILLNHEAFIWLRDKHSHSSARQLLDIVLDVDRFLLERCLAGWFLTGIRRYDKSGLYEVVGKQKVFEWAIEQLDISPWLSQTTVEALRITQSEFPIYQPIKLSQLECGETKIDIHHIDTQYDDYNIPPYLLDHKTHEGQEIIQSFLNQEEQVTDWLSTVLPPKAWVPAIGCGLGYVFPDAVELHFHGSDKLKRLAFEASCHKIGLRGDDIDELMKILNDLIETFTVLQTSNASNSKS